MGRQQQQSPPPHPSSPHLGRGECRPEGTQTSLELRLSLQTCVGPSLYSSTDSARDRVKRNLSPSLLIKKELFKQVSSPFFYTDICLYVCLSTKKSYWKYLKLNSIEREREACKTCCRPLFGPINPSSNRSGFPRMSQMPYSCSCTYEK